MTHISVRFLWRKVKGTVYLDEPFTSRCFGILRFAPLFFFFPPLSSFSLFPSPLLFFFLFMRAPRMNGPTSYNLRRRVLEARRSPLKFHRRRAHDSTHHPRDHFPRIFPQLLLELGRYLAPDAFDNRAGQRYVRRENRGAKLSKLGRGFELERNWFFFFLKNCRS